MDPPALLERDAELASLDELIGATPCGRSVVIEGPPGIGKSRLLAEAGERARARGFGVHRARGSELEREYGYGVVRQLFERPLAGMPPEERARVLAGAAAPAAAVLVPATPVADARADASFATLHGLYWAAANLADRRPLMLVIDDLHWCDAPSLRWLAYLLRRADGLSLSVAVALRPAEPGADAGLLAHITHDPLARVLKPAQLSRAGAEQLVRAMVAADADDAFCAACHQETNGNPLLLGQLLSAVAAERVPASAADIALLRRLGGDAIARIVGLRLSGLSRAAGALAGAAGILGDGADLRIAAALAGLDEDAAHGAATALAAVEILRPELPPAFVHPMVRAAVLARLSPPERARGHARAARLLAAAGAPGEAVAAQLLHAPPAGDAWVAGVLCEAARRSLPRGAADSAVSYLRRAMAEPPPFDARGDVLLELAEAESLLDGPAALASLQEADALATTPERRGRIAVVLGDVLYLMGRPDDAMTVLSEARDRLGPDHAGLRRELDSRRLQSALNHPELYPLGRDLLERFEAEPETPDLTGRMLLAWRAQHEAYASGSRERTLELARRARAGGALVAHANGSGSFAVLVFALLAADEQEAEQVLEESLSEAHKRGSVLGFAAARVFGSRLALAQGAVRDAEARAREGLEACDAWGIAIGPAVGRAYLADALMEQGSLDAARDVLDAVDGPEQPPFRLETSWLLESRARLLLRRGEQREGVARMLDVGRGFAALGGRNPACHPWRSEAALGCLGLGDVEQARGLAEEEVALARAWGAPRPLGRALRVAGLVTGGTAGIELLSEAVAVLAPSSGRLEHAKALVDLGAAMRRANRRADARKPLQDGLELATVCSAPPLAERAETELLATGARLRRTALSGVGALTPSERRVTELAASGASNREIAQTLFVTVKTVEVHLTSAYRKLDISSRASLPAALAAPG
jgi:DNA-binding CsgD family transcriptional regulator